MRVLAAILVLVSASGCVTPPHKTLTMERHAAIHSVSVAKSVAVPKFPAVAGPAANTAAFWLGSLAAVSMMTSENSDTVKLEKLFADQKFDMGDTVREEFVSRLAEIHAFPKVDVEGGDAVFDLKITSYGALTGSFSPMSPINPPIRPFLIVTAKLSTPDGKVLWQNTANIKNVEQQIDEYPFVDMIAHPTRTVSTFRKTARLVVAELLQDLGAHPSAASNIGPSPQLASVPAAAGSPAAPGRGAPVASGGSWTYKFTDKIFSQNSARVTVSEIRAANGIVKEQLSARSSSGPATAMDREIDARAASFSLYPFSSNETLTEFAPYLFAAGGEKAVRDITNATGYPTEGHNTWIIHIATPVWDTVTVPAGTFRAMRLEIDGGRMPRGWDVNKFTFRVWYAPKVGRYVKYERRGWMGNEQISINEAVELLEFSPHI